MFGDRLKLARKKAGYSLRGLSDALGGAPTAQAIGKYERGEMMPSSSVLLQIARVLGVSLEYLLSERVEELEATEFRKLSGISARDRARVEAAVIDGLQRYLAIEEILELDSGAWRAPQFGNRFLGREEDGEILAEDLRQDWKLGVDPIPNMTSLLEDRGIKVLVISLPEGVSGLTCLVRRPRHKTRVPVIVVNAQVTLERRRLTLAHELAHVWLGSEGLSGFEGLVPEGTAVEDWCNQAAAELLVPARELRVRWVEVSREKEPFGTLARMFKVSPIVASRRALDLDLVDRTAFFAFYEEYVNRERACDTTPSGGNFYNNQNTRVGELFAGHVLRAAMEGRIGFKQAYDLTGLQGGAFERYAKRLGADLP